jgi:hypothetical protein
MKLNCILGLLMALLIAPFTGLARALAPKGLDACNIAGDRDGPISRIAEAAISAHQLVATGTNPLTQVIVNTALLRPLGTAYDDIALAGRGGIRLLTEGGTKRMIASKAITAGALVYTTAGGKVTDTPVNNCFMVGRALTTAAVDTDEIEVDSCFPVLTTV